MHVLLFCAAAWLAETPAAAHVVAIEVDIPELDARPYHRPYVAIWLETLDREGIRTIAVWREKEDWLKDVRQWWRKLGRNEPRAYDGVSGATRKPGRYVVQWDGLDDQGRPVPPGEYYLNVEAAREEGGRDFLRQKIILGSGKPQRYALTGDLELGQVAIHIH